ncbi:C-type lectin domain family 4 member E-like isoform 2-T2 [Clarias gariepinus]|uniref:C-type lectin domain family 4 member E-like isoform X2 n=1 Tax=Clarias gariepinus TaxID=13013 RepID=UPI00234D45FB|nr:C-type lectin domain family 4 member E-like isoform X2 [Clarias gariepinus]
MPGGCYSAANNDDGGGTAWNRWSKLIAVCLVVLCVVLLIVVIVLSNHPSMASEQFQREKEQFQREKEPFQREKEQFQREKDQFQTERDQFQRERAELQRFLKLGWIYFSSSVYIIINEQKSWSESRQNCRERGADLVIITSTEEQEFVTKLLGEGRRAWIGLSGRGTENKWKWVDDTPLGTVFWASGEPNSAAGPENCVITGDATDPKKNWADDPCNRQYNWICEKKIFN